MKLHYGIAVTSSRQLAELPELKGADFLEISSGMIQTPDFAVPKGWKKRLFRAGGRSEARTFSALIGAGSGMMLEFYRLFSANCGEFVRLGIREVTLAVDWETLLSDEGYANDLRDVIRCCYGILTRYQLQLLLELRIPGVISARPMDFLKFRNSLLMPVRTLIDLHPHEPGALELLAEFSAKMPFDSSRFRLSFDSSGGNYLSANLLEKIKESIRPVGKEIPEICFYPGRSADKAAYELLDAVMR